MQAHIEGDEFSAHILTDETEYNIEVRSGYSYEIQTKHHFDFTLPLFSCFHQYNIFLVVCPLSSFCDLFFYSLMSPYFSAHPAPVEVYRLSN